MERPRIAASLNSLNYDYYSIRNLINKVIKDHSITVPPTKESLSKLFEIINLKVSPVKIIDCLVFIKSAANRPLNLKKRKDPKTGKDIEDDWVYDTTKLVSWLHLNIRTFQHLDETKVDAQWMEEIQEN